MKNTVFVSVILGLLLTEFAAAQLPAIDRTDKVSDRRYLDSLNVYNRRPIRVNQSGFRPQDNKYAYVADPAATSFKVVDANTGKEVEAGNNTLTLLDQSAPKPGIWVNGAFNSLEAVYEFGSLDSTLKTETLYKADFTNLTTVGEYYLVVGNDTSATFHVHPAIYNAILENSLKFFGIQRCGDTKSHLHAKCHMKDGSEIGHDLTGGWHDCGDHFKVSETLGYTAYALATTYLVYQDKAEDRYGNSYDDTVFTDGIPDILYEAKIGADYIFKLYKASKADGLIAQNDMYHSIAVGSEDHQFWDVPEKQDAQPQAKGGPDRHVAKGIGTIAGMYAASLAYFATGWQVYDPVYADSLLSAAKDIYANVLIPHTHSKSKGTDYATAAELGGFYPGGTSETNMIDDAAAAALALWYATKDTSYQYDLYKNTDINNNATNYGFNNEPDDAGPYFRGGFLGLTSGFYPGGWMTDFENVHAYVLFSFVKLILSDKDVAKSYNVGELECDTLLQRATNALRRLTDDGSQGSNKVYENRFGSVKSVPPYNLVWTSSDWGFNRYNMGAANAIFMLSEITTGAEKEAYKNLALDNIYYNLGANPWDISFIMGAGDKNQNHPHNRSANPDGYNAGGMPYKYKCPRGALMGGSAPTKLLLEDWKDYTATETCIDFSVQLLMPAQSLAETLPIDAEGPLYSNIAGTPITETSAIISWDASEVALTTVFYNTTPDAATAKSAQQTTASKGGALTIDGLVMGQTYYFFLEGMDTKRNMTTDDNHGQWYQFTMTPATTTISGVTICQVDHRSAKIFWWSGDRMNGIVNFGTSPSNITEAQAAEGGAVLFHQATLNDLKPGTTYYFSVSSGATTEDNGGSFYSFTTDSYATYADLDVWVKPSAYQDETNCSPANGWQKCSEFIVEIDNNDTIAFEDFELRFYLGANTNLQAVSYIKQSFDGTGTVAGSPDITFGSATTDGVGQYYLPITVKSPLYVSGRIIFQMKFTSNTFASFENGWSLIAHNGEDDPEKFNGVDLTQAPYFIGSETSQLETNSQGVRVVGFTRDPYVPVYYHGKHIYGYGPDYTPENGPQVNRTVKLNFASPFVTPAYSVEKEDSLTSYAATSAVSPTGILDDFEINGVSRFANTVYAKKNRKDSLLFGLDTTLAYGNNYMEFVSWHNHGANKNGSYDCACAIVRSNVEVDTIVTPPEQRYLVFTVDTVNAYTGKMVEVHVQLFDSTMTLLNKESLSILLSTESGLAKFYTSATATIPTERIDIVNGEAVFYLSSDKATETILKASAKSTAAFAYTTASAVLIVKDLPPWPIIDVAKMVDTNCDKIPDAMAITLSNEYIAAEGQSFNSIRFVYNGDTLTAKDLISENGKDIVVKVSLPSNEINTNPAGYIELISNVGNKWESAPDFYQDGISPVLMSVSVLERLDTATVDRVYLQFSEPIKSPSLDWPLTLYPNDQAITVKNVKLYNEAFNIWEFEIGFGAEGVPLVSEGMQATLLPTAPIRDIAGNGISECAPDTLPILLKLLPIPMTYASISDANEDGYAEHVEIQFVKAVDSKHIPDSMSVIFGSATPETLTVAAATIHFSADYQSASIDLNPAFALGNTNGPYDGTLNGKEVVGAGLAIQHLGTGAAYESNDILAEDFAGPVIASAALKGEDIDAVAIHLSEPVNILDSSFTLFLRERDSLSVHRGNVYNWNLKNTLLSAMDTSNTFIMEGDRVRLAPQTMSAFIDKSGNLPAMNNPWVVIDGNGKPKIDFNIYMAENLTHVKASEANAPVEDPTMKLYVVNQTTHKLDLIDAKTGVVIQHDIDTTKTPLRGPLWVFDLTVPRGAAVGEAAAWSLLTIKYNLPIYTNLGTFVNRINGTYDVQPDKYLSTNNKLTLLIEWTNTVGIGLRDQNGRAVGTGAYIYKVDISARFTPSNAADEETRKRFSSKSSYDQSKIFGIKRSK